MKDVITGILIGSVLGMCALYFINKQRHTSAPIIVKQSTPLWVAQNIDAVKSCDIILQDGMSLIKVGNTFTVILDMSGVKFYKSDKKRTYLDFDLNSRGMLFYSDTCQLKEDLRGYIKLQMAKAIEAKLYY